ncbi:MAG TPA: hypothetical protein VF796_09130 [Humisphaera sp.]
MATSEPLPRIYMDFNGYSLLTAGTQADLARQGLVPYDGMRCVFYQDDADDEGPGFLHTVGTVRRDAETGYFYLDTTTVEFRFTHGTVATAVLDAVYGSAQRPL